MDGVGESQAPAGGKLFLMATPIGNLEDMTLRALRVLREADLVAAEDTRRAGILLSKFEIKVPMTSYHAHNEHQKTAWLLQQVMAGKRVVMLSDAGTPCVSDPGYLLARDAVAAGIEPEVIPGVSALTHAVVASGLPVSSFVFGAFLPHKSGKRRTMLRSLAEGGRTVILFESPFRIEKLLQEVAEELGAETPVVLIREATKLHEERVRGQAAELLASTAGRQWKGEFTVVIGAGSGLDCKD